MHSQAMREDLESADVSTRSARNEFEALMSKHAAQVRSGKVKFMMSSAVFAVDWSCVR